MGRDDREIKVEDFLRVGKTMPFAPSPSHHHFYRWHVYHSQMGGKHGIHPHHFDEKKHVKTMKDQQELVKSLAAASN